MTDWQRPGPAWWTLGRGIAPALLAAASLAVFLAACSASPNAPSSPPQPTPIPTAALAPGELPGPIGGPEIAQDVNTLVGKRAPAFTLPDSEGKSYAVTPGTGKPLVLVFHMGITWQLCVQQLGELQKSADALRQQADAYVINSDTPAYSRRLKQISGISVPVLLDPSLTVAGQYDMLPKPTQPMGEMRGVAQMGFVIVDAGGIIRVQRADIRFGEHAGQMLQILQYLQHEAPPAATPVKGG